MTRTLPCASACVAPNNFSTRCRLRSGTASNKVTVVCGCRWDAVTVALARSATRDGVIFVTGPVAADTLYGKEEQHRAALQATPRAITWRKMKQTSRQRSNLDACLLKQFGAGTRNRTATYCLEGSHSTVKPCPRSLPLR